MYGGWEGGGGSRNFDERVYTAGRIGQCDCEPVWLRGKALSPFLIGRMFVREPSWEYSANLVGS